MAITALVLAFFVDACLLAVRHRDRRSLGGNGQWLRLYGGDPKRGGWHQDGDVTGAMGFFGNWRGLWCGAGAAIVLGGSSEGIWMRARAWRSARSRPIRRACRAPCLLVRLRA